MLNSGASLVVTSRCFKFGNFDVPEHFDFLAQPNPIPANVNLVPFPAVPGISGISVVVVVPPFPPGQQSYPPVVPGVISGGETLFTPHMGGRVYQPGGMQPKRYSQEDPP